MNLRNTTSTQDVWLESEHRAALALGFDPRVYESILEDIDNKLTSSIDDAESSSTFTADRIKELETRISELENALYEANDRAEGLERQLSESESNLNWEREHRDSDSPKNT